MGGRVLFTNAATLAGLLRREELIARSRGMGEFVFIPYDHDQQLLQEAGFSNIRADDVTANAAHVAAHWR